MVTNTGIYFPHRKAWTNREVRAPPRAKLTAFQSGDEKADNTSKARLKACIKEARCTITRNSGSSPYKQVSCKFCSASRGPATVSHIRPYINLIRQSCCTLPETGKPVLTHGQIWKRSLVEGI